MMTVVESPQSKLRRELGLSERPTHTRIRVGDWLPFCCGDLVREHEGRHIGRVEAVFHGAFVRVRWLDSGWVSDLRPTELVKAKRDE